MEVQEAIKLAKGYIVDVFSDEEPTNIGLEEIEFDDRAEAWDVTIGFSRPWNSSKSVLATISGEPVQKKRAYKIVRVRDSDGKMLGIRRRDIISGD